MGLLLNNITSKPLGKWTVWRDLRFVFPINDTFVWVYQPRFGDLGFWPQPVRYGVNAIDALCKICEGTSLLKQFGNFPFNFSAEPSDLYGLLEILVRLSNPEKPTYINKIHRLNKVTDVVAGYSYTLDSATSFLMKVER